MSKMRTPCDFDADTRELELEVQEFRLRMSMRNGDSRSMAVSLLRQLAAEISMGNGSISAWEVVGTVINRISRLSQLLEKRQHSDAAERWRKRATVAEALCRINRRQEGSHV